MSAVDFLCGAQQISSRNDRWQLCSRFDALGQAVFFLQSEVFSSSPVAVGHEEDVERISGSGGSLRTFFISYCEAFRVPQFHFQQTGIAPPINESRVLIVSPTYCEELGLALFGVHQCDMEGLLALAQSVSVSCDTVTILLRMVGPVIGMPSELLS